MGPLLATRFLESAPDVDAAWTRFWLHERAEFNARNALRHRAGRLHRRRGARGRRRPCAGDEGRHARRAALRRRDDARFHGPRRARRARADSDGPAPPHSGEAGYHERTNTGRPSTLHVALERGRGAAADRPALARALAGGCLLLRHARAQHRSRTVPSTRSRPINWSPCCSSSSATGSSGCASPPTSPPAGTRWS